MKTLHEDNPLTDEAMDDLRKEADAMAILTSESLHENEGSKHILKMYGVCDGKEGYFIHTSLINVDPPLVIAFHDFTSIYLNNEL